MNSALPGVQSPYYSSSFYLTNFFPKFRASEFYGVQKRQLTAFEALNLLFKTRSGILRLTNLNLHLPKLQFEEEVALSKKRQN